MNQDRNPENGQAKVPKPPNREDIEKISEAQKYITDDWTGDGPTPPDQKDADKKDG
ncbi:hypothetical protein [Azospirillum soli]|uniref:hypothetical protein n=1 Tax=Azospirillum soli TaxID=1304799 RepID=UPI001AE31299|nr:hypothetical protein [Azospirillum soli]MBP2313539.1 hypothetical protein [Azospirillum soli]